jgi:hypothetical protein
MVVASFREQGRLSCLLGFLRWFVVVSRWFSVSVHTADLSYTQGIIATPCHSCLPASVGLWLLAVGLQGPFKMAGLSSTSSIITRSRRSSYLPCGERS